MLNDFFLFIVNITSYVINTVRVVLQGYSFPQVMICGGNQYEFETDDDDEDKDETQDKIPDQKNEKTPEKNPDQENDETPVNTPKENDNYNDDFEYDDDINNLDLRDIDSVSNDSDPSLLDISTDGFELS